MKTLVGLKINYNNKDSFKIEKYCQRRAQNKLSLCLIVSHQIETIL